MSSNIYSINSSNPILASINRSANLARNNIYSGQTQATSALEGGNQQAIGYLTNQVGDAQRTIAPFVKQGYSALDTYMQALGIATPKYGSEAYNNSRGMVANLDNQLAALQSQREQLKSAVLAAKSQKDKMSLNQQLTSLNQQINSLTAQRPQIAQQEAQMGQMQSSQEAQAGVVNALRSTPGYQFAFDQGQNAIESGAAARGGLFSGRTALALNKFGTGLADQTYQSYVNNAANAVGQTSPFVNKKADLSTMLGQFGYNGYLTTGQRLADLNMGASESVANINLGQGSALAGYLSGQAAQGQMANLAQQQGAAYQSGYLR